MVWVKVREIEAASFSGSSKRFTFIPAGEIE
jgi:hypothetical protein